MVVNSRVEVFLRSVKMSAMHDADEAERRFLGGIRRSIESSGLSQKELAAKSGLSRQYIYDLRNGAEGVSLSAASRLASALSVPLSQLLGEEPASHPVLTIGPGNVVPLPLVAQDVAAGAARIPSIGDLGPGDVYYFREDWLRQKHGWHESAERLFCIRLAKAVRDAGSMEPTIYANSIVLCDREPLLARERLLRRSIWLVCIDDGLTVKRVTIEDGMLMLESDAPGPEHAPRALRLKGLDIRRVLPGKVIWWGTNASHAEGG